MDFGKLAQTFAGDQNPLRIRFGKVSSIQNDRTITVTIGGSTTTISGVKYLSASAPLIGAPALFFTDGVDIFFLDHVAASGRTLAPRATRSTNQSITDSADTPVTFDAVDSDLWTCWAIGSPTLLTVPMTGRYTVRGIVAFAANATGFRRVWIDQNGTTTIGRSDHPSASASTDSWIHVSTPAITLTKGDTIRLLVRQTSGGALNILTSLPASPSLSLIYEGP